MGGAVGQGEAVGWEEEGLKSASAYRRITWKKNGTEWIEPEYNSRQIAHSIL